MSLHNKHILICYCNLRLSHIHSAQNPTSPPPASAETHTETELSLRSRFCLGLYLLQREHSLLLWNCLARIDQKLSFFVQAKKVHVQIVSAQIVSGTNCIGTNCIGTICMGTICIGHKLYREQIVSGTNRIGYKLYRAQIVSAPFHFITL
jgi:hypothetical protein